MDMVEKVAQALAGSMWRAMDERERYGWRVAARRAIAAMREPTEGMVWAGINANRLTIDGRPLWKCTDDIQARERFSAMIDAALTSEGS